MNNPHKRPADSSSQVRATSWLTWVVSPSGITLIISTAILAILASSVLILTQPQEIPTSTSASFAVAPQETPFQWHLPTVEPNPAPVPKYQTYAIKAEAETSKPVVQDIRVNPSGDAVVDQMDAFYVAFAKDDVEAVASIGTWFRNNAGLDPRVSAARQELVNGLVTVFGAEVSVERFGIGVNAAKALFDLGASAEAEMLVTKLAALPDPQEVAAHSPNISNAGSTGGDQLSDSFSPSDVKLPLSFQEDSTPYVAPVADASPIAIGGSPIPVLWSIRAMWDLMISAGKEGSLVQEGDYYLVGIQKNNYLEKLLRLPVAPERFDYQVLFFSPQQDTIPNLDPNFAELFGIPRGFWHGMYDDPSTGMTHYWWAMIVVWTSGINMDSQIGDVLHVQSSGPLVFVR